MKSIIAILALTVSVASFAQEKVYLTKKKVEVAGSSATLMRVASTPSVVEVTFNVPMRNSICRQTETYRVPQTCSRPVTVYRTERRCTDVPVVTSNPNAPRGPNYNPPTRRVCEDVRVASGTIYQRYDCSYISSRCVAWDVNTNTEKDKVKIKFKNMPALGGTEEEEIKVSARQRTTDATNVLYDIEVSEKYEVVKKGIFGVDSYVIKPQ